MIESSCISITHRTLRIIFFGILTNSDVRVGSRSPKKSPPVIDESLIRTLSGEAIVFCLKGFEEICDKGIDEDAVEFPSSGTDSFESIPAEFPAFNYFKLTPQSKAIGTPISI
jgi:hypothetical protein